MSIEKDIKQYNKFTKLKKLVNKINKIEEQGKTLKCDIDLQDLLLALKKTKEITSIKMKIENYANYKSGEVCYIEYKYKGEKSGHIIHYDIFQLLSNQKEEVYNKLIEILS